MNDISDSCFHKFPRLYAKKFIIFLTVKSKLASQSLSAGLKFKLKDLKWFPVGYFLRTVCVKVLSKCLANFCLGNPRHDFPPFVTSSVSVRLSTANEILVKRNEFSRNAPHLFYHLKIWAFFQQTSCNFLEIPVWLYFNFTSSYFSLHYFSLGIFDRGVLRHMT